METFLDIKNIFCKDLIPSNLLFITGTLQTLSAVFAFFLFSLVSAVM